MSNTPRLRVVFAIYLAPRLIGAELSHPRRAAFASGLGSRLPKLQFIEDINEVRPVRGDRIIKTEHGLFAVTPLHVAKCASLNRGAIFGGISDTRLNTHFGIG